jgi:5,10-methylenetetrahydromethanopterin reductase
MGAAGLPGRTARMAARLEEEGWDGLGLVDSQNLAPDPYPFLALAAAATTRLKLATGVTNPVTRHPAVTATSIASVHAESQGRAVLGIGRGDSALAHLGFAPASPDRFERYLAAVQGYLSQQDVPFDEAGDSERLGMAGGPTASRTRWLAAVSLPKVPVGVAATGPKVIAIGARLGDAVTFAVGAGVERLAWAVDVARRARVAGGLDPDGLGLGAYLPVVVHPDRDRARELIAGGVASFARFSVMHGTVTGPVEDGERATLEAVHGAYDMNHHFTHGSPQSGPLTPEVIDTFGIAGPPDYCVERIRALTDLGLTRIFVLGGGLGADRGGMRQSHDLLTREVLPAFR